MGLWAGIKYAMNNTLGTKNFTPLNEIMENQFRIEADENKYARVFDYAIKKYEVSTNVQTQNKYFDIPEQLKILKEGTITLKGRLGRDSTSAVTSRFKIYKNGEQIFSHSDAYGENVKTFSVTIPVNVYDVLTFSIGIFYTANAAEGKTHTVTLDYLDMYGSIKQNVFHTITG